MRRPTPVSTTCARSSTTRTMRRRSGATRCTSSTRCTCCPRAAFNSMLKTLEEPPEHVKFVLATTDPQKIPVTVLSRCLQFNLTPLPRAAIAERLAHILDAESIAYDAAALPQLAARRAGLAARRAFAARPGDRLWRRRGAGNRRAHDARRRRSRLSVSHRRCAIGWRMVRRCSPKPMRWRPRGRRLRRPWMSSRRFSIGLPSSRPCRAPPTAEEAERIAAYASRFAPESVQLAYQICAQGRADLALAPDEATGFSMTLLRLLAFEPATRLLRRRAPDRLRRIPATQPRRVRRNRHVREPVRPLGEVVRRVAGRAVARGAESAHRRSCRRCLQHALNRCSRCPRPPPNGRRSSPA